MSKNCVVFGSSMGNTEEAAALVASNLGISDVLNISDTDAQTLNSYDKIVFGTSTWGSGDLQDDWDSFDFGALNLAGKTAAIFGMGDSSSYSDTFCDAMGKLYDKIVAAGANVVGAVSPDGYTFDASESLRNGEFVGLPLDADNESDKTKARIDAWTDKIKSHFA